MDDAISTLARRDLLKGLGGVSLAALLADPRRARAAGEMMQTVAQTLPTGETIEAAFILPDGASVDAPVPSVLLIHEWWGLNDQIKTVAADFARQGYAALAVDLMDGAVAVTPEAARAQMQAVDPDRALETLVAWIDWLRARADTTRALGTLGWCFGGGWSLGAAIAAPVDACVVYYGRVNRTAEELARLQGPVLGHFATRDQFIDRAMVDGFVDAMAAAGQALTVYRYDADHAFANPSSAAYDKGDAKLAWQRTTSFFAQTLKGAG